MFSISKGKIFSLCAILALVVVVLSACSQASIGSGTTQATPQPTLAQGHSTYLCKYLADGGTVGANIWTHFNCGLQGEIVEIGITHRDPTPFANLIDATGKNYTSLSLKQQSPIHKGRAGNVWQWNLPSGGSVVVFIARGFIHGGIKAGWTLSNQGRESLSFEVFGGPKNMVFQDGNYVPGATALSA